MKIYRPLQISFNHQVLEQNRRFYFTASATLGIDLNNSEELLDLHYLQDVFEVLGETALPDTGMPKPKGEYLISGSFFAPGSQAVEGGIVKTKIGPLKKELFIFGPREWKAGFPSIAEKISFMPVDFTKAFGGEGFEKNPEGMGYNDGLLPCIENPNNLVGSKGDKPEPVSFAPLYPMLPQRMKYQGTYDSDYKKKYFPGFPEDHDWKYFMCAPEDQWVESFFTGDEEYAIDNMHPDIQKIEGRLPGLSARCFINHVEKGFAELPLNLDTLWFFPEKMLALLIFRGVTEVEDDEAENIQEVLCSYEDKSHTPRSVEYYKDALEKRNKSDDELLKNFNTQDLIPEGHKCAMELLVDTGLAKAGKDESALIKNMEVKADLLKQSADEEIEQAIARTETNMQGMDIPEEGKVDIRQIIKGAEDTKIDPDVEIMNKKIEEIIPGITTNDPEKFDLKDFSFDKLDKIAEITEEFSNKKEADAKELAGSEIKKIKSSLLEKISSIDIQIKKAFERGLTEDSERVNALKDEKKPLKESLKVFEDFHLDRQTDIKSPLPRIDTEKIRSQQEQINPRVMEAMQYLQSMKSVGEEDEKIKEMEKQIHDMLDKSSSQMNERLGEAEKGFKEGYLMGAHFMEEGLSPHREPVEKVKEQLLSKIAEGRRVSGGDWACLDLAGINLDGVDFSNAFLEQVNFSGASLQNADFCGAVLARANLEDADCTGSNFEGANVGGVYAHRTNFSETRFKSAKLSRGDFTGADFTNANLEDIESLEIKINSAYFNKTVMPKINFIKTEMAGVSFIETDISKSSFVKCVISDSDFSNSAMKNCAFVDCRIEGTCFEKADLSKTCFLSTDPEKPCMKNLKFKASRLNQANFQNMIMHNADLRYANLENAYFGGADLSGSNLANALAKNTQFRKAKLTNAILDNINLEQGSLEKAILTGASFKGANLYLVNFLRSTITNTDFSNSNLDMTLIENWRPE